MVDSIEENYNLKTEVFDSSSTSIFGIDFIREIDRMITEELSGLEGSIHSTKELLDILDRILQMKNKLDISGKGAFPYTEEEMTKELQYVLEFLDSDTPFNREAEKQKLLAASLGKSKLTQQEKDVLRAVLWVNRGTMTEEEFVNEAHSVIKMFDGKSSSDMSHEAIGKMVIQSKYERLAREFFSNPLQPTIDPSFSPEKLLELKTELDEALERLDQATAGKLREDPNSFYNKAKNVSDSIGDDPYSWMMDNYDSKGEKTASNAGSNLDAITRAITAGESLNDKQKEQARKAMLVLEEWYKTAASIISEMNKNLQNLARNIARS